MCWATITCMVCRCETLWTFSYLVNNLLPFTPDTRYMSNLVSRIFAYIFGHSISACVPPLTVLVYSVLHKFTTSEWLLVCSSWLRLCCTILECQFCCVLKGVGVGVGGWVVRYHVISQSLQIASLMISCYHSPAL